MTTTERGAATIHARLARLAPVAITADTARLPESERAALAMILEAARVMDRLYRRQVWPGNAALEAELAGASGPDAAAARAFYAVMAGPWDRLDEDHPVLTDQPKPAGAAYYPEDITRAEIERWLADHPETTDAMQSNFTLVRRTGDELTTVPYTEAYRDELERAAGLLEEAANLTAERSLARFVRSRAAAFRSNDYYQSDIDWMDLAGVIDLVIGPYEVYEDALMGWKAAFSAFVTVVDQDESERLAVVGRHLDGLEARLPLPERYRGPKRGSDSPIKVVNVVLTAGDANAGIQVTAFNLPNDERVREAKGSKKVMLKNVAHAKFERCWTPIVRPLLTEAMLANVSFDAYFTAVLLHEMSHGLGPGTITLADGTTSTVSKELKDLYSVIEECKADVLGMFLTEYLLEQGDVLNPDLRRTLYPTYLGGMFRSVRFGIGEAHGGGVMVQFNYHLERGGFSVTPEGRFSVDEAKLRTSLHDLAAELLLLQATGDYAGTRRFLDHYRVLTPPMQAALAKVEDVPVDIRPRFGV